MQHVRGRYLYPDNSVDRNHNTIVGFEQPQLALFQVSVAIILASNEKFP